MLLSFKDPRNIGRLIALIMTPIFICVVFWFLMVKQLYDSPNEKRSEYLPSYNQMYVFMFFSISEYLAMQQIPLACIFRIQDRENRITHFMYSSQGSKAAYALAGILVDAIERFAVFLIVGSAFKLIILGSPFLSLAQLEIISLYLIYDMTKILLNFHSISYLFDKRQSLINLSAILSSLLYSLEFGISSSTFIFFKNKNLLPLGRLSFIRSGFNLLILLFPEGNSHYDKLRTENIQMYGGFWPNFATMLIHLMVAIGIVLFIDSRAGRIKKKTQKKDPRVVEGPDFRNLEEIKFEENKLNQVLPVISVQGIEKVYPNKFLAAHNISFGVEEGTLFTLLGPNGAGKTSVLEVLGGIENRTDGLAIYEGVHMDTYNNKNLSFCLQKNYLWEYLTFRQHLEIIGRWRGINSSELQNFITDIDIALQLDKNLDIQAIFLSGGNKRKLNTVLALMAVPHIYILDEPTAGMDPASRR